MHVYIQTSKFSWHLIISWSVWSCKYILASSQYHLCMTQAIASVVSHSMGGATVARGGVGAGQMSYRWRRQEWQQLRKFVKRGSQLPFIHWTTSQPRDFNTVEQLHRTESFILMVVDLGTSSQADRPTRRRMNCTSERRALLSFALPSTALMQPLKGGTASPPPVIHLQAVLEWHAQSLDLNFMFLEEGAETDCLAPSVSWTWTQWYGRSWNRCQLQKTHQWQRWGQRWYPLTTDIWLCMVAMEFL